MANKEKAVKMAARGATAKEIKQTTGVSGESARNIVGRVAPSAPPLQISSTPTRPASIPVSSTDAGSGASFNYRPISTSKGVFWSAGSMSDEEVRNYVMSKDRVGFNEAGTGAYVPPTPQASSSAPSQSSTEISKGTPLRQAIKIAGVGGLSKSEIERITKATGESQGQVIQQLDIVNKKLKDKGRTGIDLNSGAANMLIREAGPAYGTTFLGMEPTFGTGRIGKTLEGMRGTRATGGYQNPQSGFGRVTPATEPSLMMGGTAIRPGGREVVQGFGKQFAGIGGGTTMPTTETATGATETAPIAAPELPPEEEKVDQMMPGSSADLANWATGFKTARSSRKRSGPRAQGLASQRVNPTGAFRGGM